MDCYACGVKWNDSSASSQQDHEHERARGGSNKELLMGVKEIYLPRTSPLVLSISPTYRDGDATEITRIANRSIL
jgi:hypothetical protein